MIVFVCLIRHILLIGPLDLTANISVGVICLFSRLLFIDFLKDYLEELGVNIDLGKILWGRNYMGGGENSNTVSIKSKEIKLKDKTYMVDNNNDNGRGATLSSGNRTEKKVRFILPPRTNNTDSPSGVKTNTLIGRTPSAPTPVQPVLPNPQRLPGQYNSGLFLPPNISAVPSPHNLPGQYNSGQIVFPPTPYHYVAPNPYNLPGQYNSGQIVHPPIPYHYVAPNPYNMPHQFNPVHTVHPFIPYQYVAPNTQHLPAQIFVPNAQNLAHQTIMPPHTFKTVKGELFQVPDTRE